MILGGNLGGATSGLLCASKDLPSTRFLRDGLRVDVLYPVCGQKRWYDAGLRAEFLYARARARTRSPTLASLPHSTTHSPAPRSSPCRRYPAGWLEDFTIQRRRQALLDKRFAIDPPAPSAAPRPRSDEALLSLLPVVALGPPNSSGELNISLVRQPLPAYATRLSDIGAPGEVAAALVGAIARAGPVEKEFELLEASRFSGEDARGGAVEYYATEYVISTSSWSRRNVASFAIYDGSLFSLSCQVPRERWPELAADVRAAARSLRLGG